ncbi:MAG: DegT/DnrJ/EryC1/StrS family aminotransferase [Treponema sp.]|nr:DegT/DnrJ/EryC1/StrS family aminotransferase [Treponema sp.]
MGKDEEDAVLSVLRSGWLTTGNETIEFEKEFVSFLQNTYTRSNNEPIFCLAVNSATSGLHLALEALGIKKGDLVLLPSMTFTSTAEVARYLGAEVVFIDVGKDSFHIDPNALSETLERLHKGLPAYPSRNGRDEGFGPRGKAKVIIPVHYGGLPCDMKAILSIAEKYSLKVVEDAAHCFPSFIQGINNGEWAGLIGDAGVFSFYATKTLSTGEGGMVVTRDKKIAERIKIMRSHGIDRSIWNRYIDTKASWYYEVIEPGFKYNLSDVLAAMGRVQLKRAMDLLSIRRKLALFYDKAFKNDPHFSIPPTGEGDARHLYPLRLNLEKLSINRDEFAKKIQENDIGISVHFIPLHIMPYYKNLYNLEANDLSETMKSYYRCISLPLWPGMAENELDRVTSVVKTIASQYTK